MKTKLLSIASALSLLIIAPSPAFALFNVSQGGTGWGNFVSGAVIYGNGTNPLATTSAATSGQVLQFSGSIPTWVATSSLGIVTPPAGSNQDIQFNDNGSVGGSTLHFDKTAFSGRGQLVGSFLAFDTALSSFNRASFDFYSDAGSTILGSIHMDTGEGRYTFQGMNGVGVGILNFSGMTVNKTFTFPDVSGTLALLQSTQTWSGDNTFDKGPTATTTVTFGTMGSTASRACFNTKDRATGNDVSFYIANGAMVVENNLCR